MDTVYLVFEVTWDGHIFWPPAYHSADAAKAAAWAEYSRYRDVARLRWQQRNDEWWLVMLDDAGKPAENGSVAYVRRVPVGSVMDDGELVYRPRFTFPCPLCGNAAMYERARQAPAPLSPEAGVTELPLQCIVCGFRLTLTMTVPEQDLAECRRRADEAADD